MEGWPSFDFCGRRYREIRLPHPSRISKGEHHGQSHRGRFRGLKQNKSASHLPVKAARLLLDHLSLERLLSGFADAQA
jgi:hypothetical protein